MQSNVGASEAINANVGGGGGGGVGEGNDGLADNLGGQASSGANNNNNNNSNNMNNPTVGGPAGAAVANAAAAANNPSTNQNNQHQQQHQQQQQQHQQQQQSWPAISPGAQQQLHQQQQQQLGGQLHGGQMQHHHAQMGHHPYVTPTQPDNQAGYHHHQHQPPRGHQSYHHNQQQPQQQMQHYHHQPPPPAHHHSKQKYDHQRRSQADNESNLNHVLLITVINPHYPINCSLIHQICSPYGKVNRIVIFKKNGVQAMVEFDHLESAKRAKSMLYGCDIYSGCCTLKIEYAKPARLNVHKNDDDSYDYTNPNPGAANSGQDDTTATAGHHHHQPHHHPRSTHHNHHHHTTGGGGGGPGAGGGAGGGASGGAGQHHHHHTPGGGGGGGGAGGGGGDHHHHVNAAFSSANQGQPALMPQGHHHHHANMGSSQGTVMMVYGLQPERVNCDRLFNLFCLYGNVVRVKFLKTKEGCAMVQMGDVMAVDRCISSLNKMTLFDSELQISYSKQAFLHDVIQPFILPDGSPSFKDFMGNKNNRFKNPEVASKNRILPPSPVLHFFNAPVGITEDEIVHLFKLTSDHEPVAVKIFTPKVENIKSYSGLVTFKDPAEATEALVMCNHLNMPKPGASNPYILRLCFSPPTYAKPST